MKTNYNSSSGCSLDLLHECKFSPLPPKILREEDFGRGPEIYAEVYYQLPPAPPPPLPPPPKSPPPEELLELALLPDELLKLLESLELE